MSYENTKCPCGGTKPTDTMLCDECLAHLKDHPSMKVYKERQGTLDNQRFAAEVLCSLARSRRRNIKEQTTLPMTVRLF